MIAIGFGTGVGIDARFSTNRTVYRRRATNSMVQVRPRKGGAAVQWGVAW